MKRTVIIVEIAISRQPCNNDNYDIPPCVDAAALNVDLHKFNSSVSNSHPCADADHYYSHRAVEKRGISFGNNFGYSSPPQSGCTFWQSLDYFHNVADRYYLKRGTQTNLLTFM